jgi:hypothetical protein
MMPQEPESFGRFIKKSRVRPAIQMEWIDEIPKDPSETWTTGRFVKRSGVRSAIEIEMSETPFMPVLLLELVLRPDRDADALQLAINLFDLMNAVNKLDLSLGGSGLNIFAGEQSNGTVTITLTTDRQAGTAERMRQICERINRTDDDAVARWPLPESVKSIQVRQVA